MSDTSVVKLTKEGTPKWSIFLLTLRQDFVTSIIWGSGFAVAIVANVYGFVRAYPTMADRIAGAAVLTSSAGFQAMIGLAIKTETVAGFTQWKGYNAVVLIAAILGYLMATKYLRGEEEKGRDEILLAGQTSIGLATAQKYLSITVSAFIMSFIPSIVMFIAGRGADIGISLHQSLDLGVGIFAVIMMFVAIGGIFSQVFPTRSQANLFSLATFTILYIFRAAADATNRGYLRAYNPLGWAENFKPLTEGHLIELIPALILCLILISFSIYFAAKRDLNSSILPDNDSSKPKMKLLSSSASFSFRQIFPALLAWIVSLSVAAALYAAIIKTAVNLISSASAFQKVLGGLVSTEQIAYAYIGIIFMMFMMAIMLMAAGFVSGIRNEEATGELDILIVQPISRTKWLLNKIFLIFFGVVVASLFCSITAWLVLKTQSINLDFIKMFYAGINLAIPAIFLLGVGIFVFAVLPRITSAVIYGIVASSFLIEMLASVVKNQKWILDLSVLYHMNFAPAVDPNWHNNFILIGIGIISATVGVLIFNQRDIVSE